MPEMPEMTLSPKLLMYAACLLAMYLGFEIRRNRVHYLSLKQQTLLESYSDAPVPSSSLASTSNAFNALATFRGMQAAFEGWGRCVIPNHYIDKFTTEEWIALIKVVLGLEQSIALSEHVIMAYMPKLSIFEAFLVIEGLCSIGTEKIGEDALNYVLRKRLMSRLKALEYAFTCGFMNLFERLAQEQPVSVKMAALLKDLSDVRLRTLLNNLYISDELVLEACGPVEVFIEKIDAEAFKAFVLSFRVHLIEELLSAFEERQDLKQELLEQLCDDLDPNNFLFQIVTHRPEIKVKIHNYPKLAAQIVHLLMQYGWVQQCYLFLSHDALVEIMIGDRDFILMDKLLDLIPDLWKSTYFAHATVNYAETHSQGDTIRFLQKLEARGCNLKTLERWLLPSEGTLAFIARRRNLPELEAWLLRKSTAGKPFYYLLLSWVFPDLS